MKKALLIPIIILFCISIAQAQDLKLVSVLPFGTTAGGGISGSDVASLTSLFETKLINTGMYNVVEQAQADKILQAQAMSLSGCVDESCALEIGKLLAADTVVLGSVNKIGSLYILNAKMVNVELGKSLNAESLKADSLEEIVDQLADLVYRLAGLSGAGRGDAEIVYEEAPSDNDEQDESMQKYIVRFVSEPAGVTFSICDLNGKELNSYRAPKSAALYGGTYRIKARDAEGLYYPFEKTLNVRGRLT